MPAVRSHQGHLRNRMPLKQSVAYPMFASSFALAPFCKLIADIGYSGVEFWEPPNPVQQLKAAVGTCREHGLKVVCITSASGFNDAEKHTILEKQLIADINLAAELGILGLTLIPGRRLAHQTRQQSIDNCIRILK